MNHLTFTLLCFALAWPMDRLAAQTEGKYFLAADSLARHKQIWFGYNLKYHAGDDSSWAAPSCDDRAWENASSWLAPNALPAAGWHGRGWFRLRLTLDSALVNVPLALIINQRGAAELYLDGKLWRRFGKVAASPNDEQVYLERNPQIITFPQREVCIAVRYSNFTTMHFAEHGAWMGFGFSLMRAEAAIAARTAEVRNASVQQVLIASVPLTFALLHLALFLFYPRLFANAYFALFALGFALLYFTGAQNVFTNDPHFILRSNRLQDVFGLLTIIAGVRFAYALFHEKLPKQFWLLLFAALGFALWFWQNSFRDHTALWLFVLLCLLEMLRVIFLAMRQKKEGAWIIGVGFGLFLAAATLTMLGNLGLFKLPSSGLFIMTGFFGLLASMSLYLSRNFAQTNKTLERKLIEVQALSEKTLAQERQAKEMEMQRALLEAENARKTKELEEARQLQLSMLPQRVPQLPNLEIAVYMKTAAEVGGDYYDFHLTDDGTLTVAIGDATGHGAKAGTVVTATKSLFQVLAQNGESPEIFKKFTHTLKSMNLGRMYMAMTLIKFKDNKIKIAAAGMPPALLYRAASKSIAEINIKAMPLGSFSGFPYRQEELELFAGDTLVLMSDGLPEMFNREGEILDYPAMKTIFAEAATRAPQEIIAHLTQAGEAWANGRPQDDDVTFVVLKVIS